jgi:hypothetical protein
VIVKMIMEKQMECRLAGETEECIRYEAQSDRRVLELTSSVNFAVPL